MKVAKAKRGKRLKRIFALHFKLLYTLPGIPKITLWGTPRGSVSEGAQNPDPLPNGESGRSRRGNSSRLSRRGKAPDVGCDS